jgi:hypothetical protein
VTSASCVDVSGYTSRVAREKIALHSSKALSSSGVQVMGWKPLTQRPDRTSCIGAWVAAAWAGIACRFSACPEFDGADWR